MGNSVKVLIIEDSSDDAELYERMLSTVQGHEYSCVVTPGFSQALDFISTGQVDCVLLDYSLPGMDGLTLLKRIRATAPFLPVVMLTGQARDDLTPAILGSGANSYLEKANITQAHLHHTLSSALSFCAAARLRSKPVLEKILIINDTADDRKALARMIKSTSYASVEIVESVGGEDALSQLKKNNFQSILLDYQLPGMNGLDLLVEIRQRDPFIPIIFITGVRSVTIAVKAMQAGANEYLAKWTFDADQLSKALANAIRSGESAAKDAEILSKTMALRGSEENARLILDNSKDMISRVDADGNRLYVSASVRRLFGIPPNEFTDRKIKTLIHPADITAVDDAQAQLLAGATEEASFAFRIQHPELGQRWLETDAWPYADERSNPAGYISVTRDVTDRVQLEAEREEQTAKLHLANIELDRRAREMADARTAAECASRAKTRFLAGVSHELRTPLHGIMGYVQMMLMDAKKDGLKPDHVARLRVIAEAGEHLLDIISRVLDLAEIEAGCTAPRLQEFDVDAALMVCVCLVRPTAELKNLELAVNRSEEVPKKVWGDAKRFRQILLNLLGNAVKFTAHGHVAVQIGLSVDSTALRIEIADTGPGICADQRPLLFKEFERFETEATVGSEGAGLGLALSARLATLMGGSLGYLDNPDGGSVFWLELPLNFERSPVAGISSAPESLRTRPLEPGIRRQPLKILIADDAVINRDIAERFLREAGHIVKCVGTGAQAVESAATADFDCILLDVRMPGMNGLEATRRIRALEGKRGRVPIIALTAQVFTDQLAACRRAGMDYHLGKPFTPEMLVDAVVAAVAAAPCSINTASSFSEEPDDQATEKKFLPGWKPIDCEIPIFTQSVFDTMVSRLPTEVVALYLAAVIRLGEALLLRLHEPDALQTDMKSFTEDAHALAGSAAMLGYTRLADVGRRFERSVESGQADSSLVVELRRVIEATCNDAELRVPYHLAFERPAT